jgi:hypothetical protein
LISHVDQDSKLPTNVKGELAMVGIGGGGSAKVAIVLLCNGNFSNKTPLRIRAIPGATQRREATHIMLMVVVCMDEKRSKLG